jgi:hypothetical protein
MSYDVLGSASFKFGGVMDNEEIIRSETRMTTGLRKPAIGTNSEVPDISLAAKPKARLASRVLSLIWSHFLKGIVVGITF